MRVSPADTSGPVPPTWGWRHRDGGRAVHVTAGVEYQATTTQAAGLYPFTAGSGSPLLGVPIGRHQLWGESVLLDPFEWLNAGLITDDEARAANCAQALEDLNRERRRIEATMLEQALEAVKELPESGAVFFREKWHEGVVGILASRLKDRLHRPVVCFARAADPQLLKGSGRSIPGLHLRDCLDLVAKRLPGVILRFGGHAQAAGLTIAEAGYASFAAAFEGALEELLPDEARLRTVETAGKTVAYSAMTVAVALAGGAGAAVAARSGVRPASGSSPGRAPPAGRGPPPVGARPSPVATSRMSSTSRSRRAG